MSTGAPSPEQAYDVLTCPSDPHSSWSTVNLSEAIPGVVSPLGWSVWGPGSERATRRTFRDLGVLPRAESDIPARPEDRAMSIFYGRPALRVDFWATMGNRLPGTSGEAIAKQLAASVPPGFDSRPERRYYPQLMLRFPVSFARAVWLVRGARQDIDRWWRDTLRTLPTASEADARQAFLEGISRFHESLYRQGMTVFFAVQPIYDLLSRLAAPTDIQPEGLMGGHGGHEETAVVRDLWACSRGTLDLDTFLDRHGYHGPLEGEISSTVWRENPAPVVDLIERYRALGDAADPSRSERERAQERQQRERDLLAAVGPSRRAAGRVVLRLAKTCLPLRGVAKVMFLQSLDVTRAAARRLGHHLVSRGLLSDPEDVFMLTASELVSDPPAWSQGLIESRRSERSRLEKLELPVSWLGPATPVEAGFSDVDVIEGVGASPGTVEGTVRVILDPAVAEVEPGDILVAKTTDPSWASILFLSSALVVDVGSLLSHAAVVARELGIPCVVNTQFGTKALRTGDRCVVDGGAGVVKVIGRASRT